MNEKDCTPDTCPHAALLKLARAACIACTCGGKPAGHGGQVSADAAGEAIISRQRAYIDRSPRGQVTKLGQRTEDMAAELFRRWQGLDTIDSLLALHLANGGTCANFGAYLERTHAAIDKLRPERKAFRATAWCKWQGILKRLPLLRGVQSWRKGHGGAKPGQGKGVRHHFENPDKEAKRIERLRIAAAKKDGGGSRMWRKTQQAVAQLDIPGPTGFRWLAAMVQDNELPLIVAARRLRIDPRKFLRIAKLLGIWMPHPIIERRRLKAAQRRPAACSRRHLLARRRPRRSRPLRRCHRELLGRTAAAIAQQLEYLAYAGMRQPGQAHAQATGRRRTARLHRAAGRKQCGAFD